MRCKQVCKNWQKLIDDERSLWTHICRNLYPDSMRENNKRAVPLSLQALARRQWREDRSIPQQHYCLLNDSGAIDENREFLVRDGHVYTPSDSYSAAKRYKHFLGAGSWVAAAAPSPMGPSLLRAKNVAAGGVIERVKLQERTHEIMFISSSPITRVVSTSLMVFIATKEGKIHGVDTSGQREMRRDKQLSELVTRRLGKNPTLDALEASKGEFRDYLFKLCSEDSEVTIPTGVQITNPLFTSITCLSVYKKKFLLAGGADGKVRVFSTADQTKLKELECGKVVSCLQVKHGKLFVGTEVPASTVWIFDFSSGKLERKIALAALEPTLAEAIIEPEEFMLLSLRIHNHILWMGGSDGTLMRFDLKTDKKTRLFPAQDCDEMIPIRTPVTCLRYVDGKLFYGSGKLVASCNLSPESVNENALFGPGKKLIHMSTCIRIIENLSLLASYVSWKDEAWIKREMEEFSSFERRVIFAETINILGLEADFPADSLTDELDFYKSTPALTSAFQQQCTHEQRVTVVDRAIKRVQRLITEASP